MGVGSGGVGWGGILTFMYLAYIIVHTWMLRCCYVTGHGLGGVGWDISKIHGL